MEWNTVNITLLVETVFIIASMVARLTKTKKDDKVVGKLGRIRKFIKLILSDTRTK